MEMDPVQDPLCLAFGAAISFVVSFLKRFPLVKRHPKMAAAILSALSGVLIPLVGANPATWVVIVKCVLVQFSAAVATHEAVVNPLQGSDNSDRTTTRNVSRTG